MINLKKLSLFLGPIFVIAVVTLLFSSVPRQKNNSGSLVVNSGSKKTNVVYKEVLVRELADHPENYLNQNVQVVGNLINDQKTQVVGNSISVQSGSGFYLVDGLNRIKVKPWLPSEVNLPPGNGPTKRPEIMADFIYPFLLLKGQIISGPEGWYFRVREAKKLNIPPD